MDLIQVVHDYVEKMTDLVKGLKVFLLDKETTGIISMAFSQTEIVQKDVFLLERIDGTRKPMQHLKAVCFLRPTYENVQMLIEELKDPKYGEYHLVFSNIVPDNFLRLLAEADENEVVRDVREFYGDFFAVNPDTFSLNLHSLEPPIQRMVEGLSALFLALKKKPDIRYQTSSDLSAALASGLREHMNKEKNLFEFKKSAVAPVLLILDRRNDPVTPLLHQWTYQAMVHELIGLNNNRCSLKGVPGIPKELEEVTLSPAQDDFYRQAMYNNFGDLGLNIKKLVDEYQVKMKSNQSLQSIEDMKKFIQNYPEFRKLSGNVSKHVALVGELSRLVNGRNLLDVSELQQTLACTHDHSGAVKQVREMIENPKVNPSDKLRLVLLYALRYEQTSGNEVGKLLDLLARNGVDHSDLRSVNTIMKYGGVNVRIGDLFQNKNLLAIASQTFKRGLGLAGATNVFTQHKPLLKELLDLLVAGKLSEVDYPLLAMNESKHSDGGGGGSGVFHPPPDTIFVFVVGGTTFEESVVIHEYNSSFSSSPSSSTANNTNKNPRVLLGGSSILNSASFLEELMKHS
eukprot:TRINITY_DN3480_c0_g2_i1.p1 TRINITY_DN3480_c0_g2~~TRINITY_DN3480_c0_g2_i1.p1  ORF type:complete len:571 (-),score=168.83 TRINITY_DN3480_c0_g2_i1:184-1896(-)